MKPENFNKRNTLLKVGDPVMVIAGGNKKTNILKSQVGKVIGLAGQRVVVEGLNLGWAFKRPTKVGERGSRIRIERGVHISNVMFYVEELKRPVRLRVQLAPDGQKQRGYRDPASGAFIYI